MKAVTINIVLDEQKGSARLCGYDFDGNLLQCVETETPVVTVIKSATTKSDVGLSWKFEDEQGECIEFWVLVDLSPVSVANIGGLCRCKLGAVLKRALSQFGRCEVAISLNVVSNTLAEISSMVMFKDAESVVMKNCWTEEAYVYKREAPATQMLLTVGDNGTCSKLERGLRQLPETDEDVQRVFKDFRFDEQEHEQNMHVCTLKSF